jgi:hypothetical protein
MGMARYSYACPQHGEFDAFYPMGEAPEMVSCAVYFEAMGKDAVCAAPARRIYSFNFQEDRRRMRKGTSPATGKPFAQSRQEETLVEKACGINFASKSDLLPHERQAIEYQQHVASGGERIENAVSMPVEPSLPLTHYMKEANYKRREFAPETFTVEHQERQYREVLAKAETA